MPLVQTVVQMNNRTQKVETEGSASSKDLQIISYDGIFKPWGVTSLTCIEQPIEEMARQAVSLLIKKIRKEETCTRMVLKTKFVLGTTTK